MGFWSRLWKRKREFAFSDSPTSQYLVQALQEAGNRPLDDFTWRIVIASPDRHWIVDITILQADAGFTYYSRGGIQRARFNAASILEDVVSGQSADDATIASAALAFFDTDFTVGANQGRTRATAWNTLALDVECKNGRLRVTRSAHRLSFPFAPLNLDFVDVLNHLAGGNK